MKIAEEKVFLWCCWIITSCKLMFILLSKLIECGVSKQNGIIHGWIVHLESKLQSFIDRLHPSSSVLHNGELHHLHFQLEHRVTHIFLENQHVYNFFHFCILKHSLKLAVESEGHSSTKSSHSCTIRCHSDHTTRHRAWVLVWVSTSSNLTNHFKRWSLLIAQNPLSTHLEFLS